MGSTPPFLRRSRSSVAFLHDGQIRAEIGVEHLVKAQTAQRGGHLARRRWCPWACRIPRPSAARTAGAGCTTTCLSGSARASHTFCGVVASRSDAPIGQAVMHWPQLMQAISASFISKGQPMCGLEAAARRRRSPPTFCTLCAGGHAAAAQDALVVVADDGDGSGIRSHTRFWHRRSGRRSPRPVLQRTASAARSSGCARR